ncbi:MAG: type II secretion system protein [Fimbriimonadales bacterium]
MIRVKTSTRRRKAFTLIELLVTVLILAILMAIALPLYLSAIKDSETKTCRANMQTIATAVQAYRVKNRLSDYGVIIDANDDLQMLEPDLGANVLCPTEGADAYDVEQGAGATDDTYRIACDDLTNHGTFEPGVNGQ